mmetsp:Transcript_29338/g.68934  ORF Transcript_29338/g.68934 Transcript_29338/m.68934 type:complete len:144 (-) Transcript_29338:404-835(-)
MLGMERNGMESHPIVILVVVVLLVLGSPGLDRIQVPLAPGVPRNRFHETRGPQPGRHGFACGGAGAGAASCWWFGTTLPPRTNPGTTTRSEVWGGAMVVVVVVVVIAFAGGTRANVLEVATVASAINQNNMAENEDRGEKSLR